MKVAPETCRAH